MQKKTERTDRQDVYTRITGQIVVDLEKGVRPWVKPWNAEHATGRITRPLRHNGQPYSGINILSLWMSATAQNFAAPIWMTFRQALELDAHVRKGEKGSLVVYANSITRTEHDEKTAIESGERNLSLRSVENIALGAVMKLVTWNCLGALSKKHQQILTLAADIMVIQECSQRFSEQINRSEGWSSAWFGKNTTKGLGVLVRAPWIIPWSTGPEITVGR